MYRERCQLGLLCDYFIIHTNIQSLCCKLEANIMLKSVKVLVAQSCSTLCNPMDCSPPGSSVCGILQARILEWATMPSSATNNILEAAPLKGFKALLTLCNNISHRLFFGEGNGTPLQYSCLENPMDGGAW